MSRRKLSYQSANERALQAFCEDHGYQLHYFNDYHVRVLGPVAIVDVWTPRMKYNVYSIDGVEQSADFRQMDMQFNPKQMNTLLEGGKL